MHQINSTGFQKLLNRTFHHQADTVRAVALTPNHESEVLAFLAQRPIHTVSMVGLIRDNGIESALNRGTFYGCFNRRNQLEGIALIGHATLLETTSDRALECLASEARAYSDGHLIMGESERIEEFWRYYSRSGQAVRRACREVLFELESPAPWSEKLSNLRPATIAEVDLVIPVHAQMALDESGVNPLDRDADGFRHRCERRISQERTWVSIENGKLVFKADIISRSSSVTYLEGIWISDEYRSQGSGSRFMSELAALLLRGTESLCLLVNEENISAQRFYQRVGFERRSVYDTIFLR